MIQIYQETESREGKILNRKLREEVAITSHKRDDAEKHKKANAR